MNNEKWSKITLTKVNFNLEQLGNHFSGGNQNLYFT